MVGIEKALVDELHGKGFNYPDINFLVNKRFELEPEAAKVILKWLPAMLEEHSGMGAALSRSLISAKEEFDPSLLINLFEKTNYNDSIKFGMSYTLSMAKTQNIAKWMKNTLISHPHPFESVGLLFGLPNKGGFINTSELIEFLKEIFDKYSFFEQYFKLFSKYGTKEDIPFLTKKFNPANKQLSQYLKKTIEKIEKKKNKPKFPLT
jgi:hypothetical protein